MTVLARAALGLVPCACGKVAAPTVRAAWAGAALFAAAHGQAAQPVRVYPTHTDARCDRPGWHWTRRPARRRRLRTPIQLLPTPREAP